MPLSFHIAQKQFLSCQFRAFNQSDYLDDSMTGVCLPLSFDWAKHFFTPSGFPILDRLSSSAKMKNYFQEVDLTKAFRPAYRIEFTSILKELAKSKQLDFTGGALSEALPLKNNTPTAQQILQHLLEGDCAVFIFLYESNGSDSAGHTIIFTSKLNESGSMKFGFFDANIGEVTCTYSAEDIQHLKNHTAEIILDSEEAHATLSSKNFYDWINWVLEYYQNRDWCNTMKLYDTKYSACSRAVKFAEVDLQFRFKLFDALMPNAITEEKSLNTPKLI